MVLCSGIYNLLWLPTAAHSLIRFVTPGHYGVIEQVIYLTLYSVHLFIHVTACLVVYIHLFIRCYVCLFLSLVIRCVTVNLCNIHVCICACLYLYVNLSLCLWFLICSYVSFSSIACSNFTTFISAVERDTVSQFT